MAQVYRPPYTETDPKTGQRIRKKSRTWHIRYYTPDGQRHHQKGFLDRRATEALATELERRAARLAAGIADPLEDYAKAPIIEHLADYVRYLAAKGNTAKHVKLAGGRARICLDSCKFIKIGDVQPSAVLSFLADLRVKGKSLKTANEYLASTKGFTRWLWRDKRSVVDPLAGIPRLASKGNVDICHARRDLSPDELRRLFEAARRSDDSIGTLSGLDRYFLYLTAAATGFRAGELRSITPKDFDLDAESPTVTVQSSCTKNRKEAVQPLPPDVAMALRVYLRDRPSGSPVWPRKWRGWRMMKADLQLARKVWLSEATHSQQREERERSDFLTYCDAQGRFADFHALRHSYITAVGKTGVSPKVHQELARHSTYAMTSRYTHARLHDLAAAVEALPAASP